MTEADDEHIVVTLAGPAVRDQPLGRRDGVGRSPTRRRRARTALPEQLVLSKDRYGR